MAEPQSHESRIQILEELFQLLGGTSAVPGAVLHGQVVLVNGVSAVTAAPGLVAGSSIVVTKRVQVGDALTVEYVTLTTDRVFAGAGSTFRVRGIVQAGATNAADQSTVDYTIIL